MLWSTIAPAQCSLASGITVSDLDMGSGVHLVAIPEWVREARYVQDLSRVARDEVVHSDSHAFYTEYEADGLEHPDEDWRGPEPRSRPDRASELIHLANTALWLAKPTNTNFTCSSHDLIGQVPCRLQCPSDQLAIIFSRTMSFASVSVA